MLGMLEPDTPAFRSAAVELQRDLAEALLRFYDEKVDATRQFLLEAGSDPRTLGFVFVNALRDCADSMEKGLRESFGEQEAGGSESVEDD